ncbi:MAG: hypothetical protein IJF59_00115 [Clostridia bacterium]|nr:hypothetical protein [Clostridia bacterium]MBQ3076572.1 hypothetical protein [Clostridia bacterium]
MPFDLFDNGLRLDQIQQEMLRPGLTLAEVTNITDPEKLNRVLCKPVVSKEEKDVLETEWCPVIQPLSGKSRGQFYMPSVGDLVLLAYLNGDPHCPYVVGGTWDQDSPPPYTVADGKNINFSIRTPAGTELLFYDEQGKEYIQLTTPQKATLLIHDEQQQAEFHDPESKNLITISWKTGEMQITAEKKITLAAGSTQLILDSAGTLSMKADQTVSAEAANINLKASNALKGEGASAEIKASGKLTLQGTTADLKGPAGVNIN